MNSAIINIKTDPKVKEEAKKTAEELGFSLSSIINAYLRQLIRTKSVKFNVQEEIPNTRLQAVITKAEEDLKAWNTSPKFKTADDFIKHLHE